MGLPGLARTVARVCASLLALGLFATPVSAQVLDAGFDPNADNTVSAVVAQTDGKLLVGGSFTHIANGTRRGVARLNADGSLDGSFDAHLQNGVVYAIAVQANGDILIGGTFTQVGASSRNYLARLHADGSVDTTFDAGADAAVRAIALQADGCILVGGDFVSIAAQAQYRIARLNTDGSVDGRFSVSADPTPGTRVYDIAVQPDGDILIAGTSGIGRVRANDGSYAGIFPVTNGSVYGVALQADGRILIAGAFTNVGGTARNRVARLDANGNLDTGFNPSANGNVTDIAVQPDGRILLAGQFSQIAGAARNRAARLTIGGAIDATLDPNANGDVLNLAALSDGGVVAAGSFTTLKGGAAARNRIARFAADGSLDTGFAAAAQTPPYAIAVQADGRLLVGANFSGRNNLARFNGDGSLDAFNPDVDLTVKALAVQADGKVLIGGLFGTVGGVTRQRLARVTASGALDSAFNPAPDGDVYAIAVQANGQILVGGTFTHIAGAARNHLARLNADGSLDAGFDPNPNSDVYCIAMQADGRILVGGNFTGMGPLASATPRNHIARLKTDGSLDSAFNPNANYAVFALVPLPDGFILAGGQFSSFGDMGGITRRGLARLGPSTGAPDAAFVANVVQGGAGPNGSVNSIAVLADGRILAGGSFSGIAGGNVANLARLSATGVLDAAFDASVNNYVSALAVQADGRVLVGGGFTTIGGGSRNFFARLSLPDTTAQTLTISGTIATWRRTGAGPELALPPELSISTDGTTYATVGTMGRLAGGWAGSFPAPSSGAFFLRVRGRTSSGNANASQGWVEFSRRFDVAEVDRVFANGFE